MARKPLEYFHQGGIQQLREQEVGGAVEGAVEIERRYICETSSFGRKVRRRKAVLLLGFSDSVADYEETKGF